jgi:hypothetical protein
VSIAKNLFETNSLCPIAGVMSRKQKTANKNQKTCPPWVGDRRYGSAVWGGMQFC